MWNQSAIQSVLICIVLCFCGTITDGLLCQKSSVAFRPYTTQHRQQTALSMVAKSGGKIIATSEDFTELVLSTELSRPVMVFFSAPWCGPCRLSVPVIREIMKQFSGQIDVVEVCTDDLPDIAAEAGVVSIPTIQMYYRTELLDTIVGCVARNVLASAVEKVLEDTLGTTPNGSSP